MRKQINRGLSVILAMVMLLSVVTTSVIAGIREEKIIPTAAAVETASATGVGEAPDIEFDYAEKYGITTAEQEKTQAANAKYGNTAGTAEAKAIYDSISSKYLWRHVGRRDVFYKSSNDKLEEFYDHKASSYDKRVKYWCRYENRVGFHVRDTAFNELAPALETTAEDWQCIVLDTDFTFHNLYYLPGSIKITSPKVLDLNGHNIYLNDISNRAFASAKQNDHEYAHYSRMFEITGNGSLTIIDSSEIRKGEGKGTGAIYNNNYMTDPFGQAYNYYTNRDIFWVDSGGKLIVYSGTFQAGRSKDQQEDGFSWDAVKKVIGSAVELGVNVAEYAYGIKGAEAALTDLQESFAQEAVQAVAEGDGTGTGTSPSTGGSTTKKTGEDGVKPDTADNPSNADSRNKAVGEKNASKNKEIKSNNEKFGTEKPTEPENKSNDKNSAKEENKDGKKADGKKEGKNVQLVNAEKAITDAALDKTKIGSMVDEAFDLVDGIVGLFSKKGPRLTQSTLGTVAHVGNNGTFVSYGGNFIGFGSTPNTRNAVVEVTENLGSYNTNFTDSDYDSKFNGGLVYVYGGNFEGRTGANIFNIVSKNTSAIKGHYETVRDGNGNFKKQEVTIAACEIYGGEPISIYNDKPVDTRNIAIRGGNFNCSAELSMAGTWENGQITMFPGTKGFMNLGIESYNPDYIKDGRIQIRDTYGDGELVLMDEAKDEKEQIHHYRLFCSELELRYNTNLQVYPGNPEANTTHSFYLVSTNGKTANGQIAELSKSWSDDENGSERGSAFADTEQYFELPVNPNGLTNKSTTGHYYITPSTSKTSNDVYGTKFAGSSLWYYSAPLDQKGKPVQTNFEYSELYHYDLVTNADGSQQHSTFEERTEGTMYNAHLYDGRYVLEDSYAYTNNFAASTKWFHYKVYRVDPLTRENIDEGNHYGDNVPLADIVYGGSNDSLNCKLTLVKLEQYLKEKWGNKKDRYGNYHFQGFLPGEMYRIVFTVDESVSYNFNHKSRSENGNFRNSLATASMSSSVLFTCYDEVSEKKKVEGSNTKVSDFTPLQWTTAPAAGKEAKATIINGKAGQTDYNGRKIFDVYYQWYVIDSDGKETMIAGTDDIYKGNDPNELKNHTITGINEETANTPSGYQYKDSMPPGLAGIDENGMPEDMSDWTCDNFHAYSEWFMGDLIKNKRLFNDTSSNGTGAHGLSDNYPYIFRTGSDTCYIPESAAGKKVYCKAIVVNTYWPLNYDHVQVFKTHAISVPVDDCKVTVEGRGGYSSYTVPYGGKFTLPEGFEDSTIGSTKEFDRWTLGKPGDVITVTSNLRVEAVWKESESSRIPTVIFDADEGTGTRPDETFSSFGITYKLPECTFTPPAGKAFDHWYVAQLDRSYVGDLYPGDTFKLTKSVKVRAEYSSRFDVYGAITQGDKSEKWFKTVTIGSQYTLPEIPEDWEKYGEKYADSWNLGKPGDKITITANMVSRGNIWLYPAYRSEKEYIVTYDANGGTFTEAFDGGSTYVVGVMELDSKSDQRLITEDGMYYDGYEFLGWKVGSSSTVQKPGEKFKVTGSVTIKAQWKQIPPPADNWHSEFDRSTGTLTVVGTGIISSNSGSYLTGLTDVYSDDLKHLVFSEGITEINKIMCGNQFETVQFPSTLEKIGHHVFAENGGGLMNVTEIDIPASVKTIDVRAFGGIASLEKVTLHEGLVDIAKDAFCRCWNLTEITIPNSVKRIGRYAFGADGTRYFCGEQEVIPGLGSSKADEFNEEFVFKTTKGSLAEDYAIKYGFNYDNGEAKPAPVTNDNISYTVNETAGTITVTGTGPIPDYNYYNAPWTKAKADRRCHKLIIGEGITSIGKYAFAGMCITEVEFPSTLKKIDDYAFMGCDVLGHEKGLTFPDKLESIGTAAFRYVGAKTISFGKGVKSIGAYAFCDRQVYKIETVQDEGYEPYDRLTGAAYAYDVEIPDNVTEIGDYAFGYYNTYDMDWRVSPFTIEAPLSNLGGKDETGKIKTLTIVTPKGSAAYKYAKANGFKTSTRGVVNYLCIGDVNYDGVVNDTDLKEIDSYFRNYIELGIPMYNIKEETADINRDGNIDETDYSILQTCLEDPAEYAKYIKPIRVIK